MPAATAAPALALSRLPWGARIVTGANAPVQAGMSGSVSTRSANMQAERVTAIGQLRLPSCCGALPEKSSVRRSPLTLACSRSTRSPSRASSTSCAVSVASGSACDAGAHAALGVVEHSRVSFAQPLHADPPRELEQPRGAGVVGRELRAQVGAPLLRLAHRGDQALDRGLVQRLRRDHDALLGEAAAARGHRAGSGAADVGVVGTGDCEAEQRLIGSEHRGDERDVGQVGSAREWVVENPRAARPMLLVQHGRQSGGHRAKMDRDVLGLHRHLPGGVEERRRAVPPLLDVGGMGGADQDRSHLLAGRAQRA